MAIFSHKWLMLWRKKHIVINLSWHGGYGPLLSLFEDLEVLILHKSPIVWPGLSKTSAPSATNLLWESINSVFRAAVGIHQFCPPSYCGNPLYIQHTFSSTMSNAFMIFIWPNLQRWKYQLTQNFIFICKCSTWIIKAFDIVEEKVCWIYSGFPQ